MLEVPLAFRQDISTLPCQLSSPGGISAENPAETRKAYLGQAGHLTRMPYSFSEGHGF
jgi:hypothetical protein